MDTIANLRVRHSLTLSVYTCAKNYLDCMDQNYLGERTEKELQLAEELHKVLFTMHSVIQDYRNRQAELLE